MKKYIWQFPVNLPGGNFAVVQAHVPLSVLSPWDETGAPARKYWVSERLFKRKCNADKYYAKIYEQQRNHNLNQLLLDKGIWSLN